MRPERKAVIVRAGLGLDRLGRGPRSCPQEKPLLQLLSGFLQGQVLATE